MKFRIFIIMMIIVTTTMMLSVIFRFAKQTSIQIARAEKSNDPLTVLDVQPASAPNDINTPIIIQGMGFTATISGTQVFTVPKVYLMDNELPDVIWGNSTTLSTTIPWGLDPGIYSLMVRNPDGITATLMNAFTVTEGIGVWTTGGPYGGDIRELIVHPVTTTKIYALVHDTGLFVSNNAAEQWEPIAINYYPWRLSIDSNETQTMYFSAGDMLLVTKDGGNSWENKPPRADINVNLRYAPVAHPSISGMVYAAAGADPIADPYPGDEGGIYRSDDFGQTWITLTVGLTDTHITALAISPSNSDHIVAGTRNGNVFLSTNGGMSWQFAAHVSTYIERIYINPFEPHEVWAITSRPFRPPTPPYLYRSLDDDLTTWAPVTFDGGMVSTLAFHPAAPGTIWADNGYFSIDSGDTWSLLGGAIGPYAFNSFDLDTIYGGSGHGILKSTDGGTTWVEKNEGLAGVEPDGLASSPFNPEEVYVSTGALGLLRSENGGGSWQSLGVSRNGYAWRGDVLAVDPYTSTRVYLADSCFSPDAVPCARISEDSGSSWRDVPFTFPTSLNNWTGESHAIAPDPAHAGKLLAGATYYPPNFDNSSLPPLGAIFTSNDYGEHWFQVSTSTPISMVVQLAYDATDSNLVYAATNGTGLLKSQDGGITWQQVPSWPGNQYIWSVVTDPNQASTVWAANWRGTVFAESCIYFSTDAGTSWTPIEKPYSDWGIRTLRFAPSNPATLYAGTEGSGLYRKSNNGMTWEQVAAVPANGTFNAIAAGSIGERVMVYVGSSGGVVVPSSQDRSVIQDTDKNLTDSNELKGGGVYRLTKVLSDNWLYLPFISR